MSVFKNIQSLRKAAVPTVAEPEIVGTEDLREDLSQETDATVQEAEAVTQEDVSQEAISQEDISQEKTDPIDGETGPIQTDSTVTEETIPDVSEPVAQEAITPTVITNVFHGGHIGLEDHFAQSSRVMSAIGNLKVSLQQLSLIDAYKKIAQDHSLSAPVVATMCATPGFLEAAANFPDPTLFNAVPEHKSSPRFAVALEAFGDADTDGRSNITGKISSLVSEFECSLYPLADRAELLRHRLIAAKKYLSESDVTDEVLEIIHIKTLSNEAFDKTLGMLEKYLVEINAFDVSEIRSDPEKIKNEIDELTDIVGDLGRILGLSLSADGLVCDDKHSDYCPMDNTFSEHKLSKSGLTFFLDKASALLDQLKIISDNKSKYIDALRSESFDLPERVEGDEVNYGLSDHTTLISSYVTLVTKLIDETIIVVSRLITAADKATSVEVDSDASEAEAPAEPTSVD